MIVAIVGAGAVGGFYGAMLKRSGYEVIFLSRGNHYQAMKEKGLCIQTDSDTFYVDGAFTTDIQDVSQADFVLFTVKSTETKDVAEQLHPVLKAGSVILTLQNGVDNEEILAGVFGADRVLSGAAYISSKVEAPGVIKQAGVQSIIIGSLTDEGREKTTLLSEIFVSAGVDCKIKSSILEKKWDKLLWNVTFNPLSAVAGMTVGEILDTPTLRETAEGALLEAVKIAESCGISIRQKVIDRVIPNGELVRNHKTSMLQDRERKKKMEIESLCGFFVHKGKEFGINTPVLRTLYAILSSIEEKREE